MVRVNVIRAVDRFYEKRPRYPAGRYTREALVLDPPPTKVGGLT